MPAKKTFGSIRVRGVAQFDTEPTHKGATLPVFKEYVALLTQVGNNPPTAVVIRNTLGVEVTFAREDVGYYFVQIPGGFPPNKTVAFIDPGFAANAFGCSVPVDMNDVIAIKTTNQVGNEADDRLGGCSFEVRVYS